MTDFRRHVGEEARRLGHRLKDASRTETPSRASYQRALLRMRRGALVGAGAMTGGSVLAAGSGAAKGSAIIATFAVVKWVGVGAISGALALGAARIDRSPSPRASASKAVAASPFGETQVRAAPSLANPAPPPEPTSIEDVSAAPSAEDRVPPSTGTAREAFEPAAHALPPVVPNRDPAPTLSLTGAPAPAPAGRLVTDRSPPLDPLVVEVAMLDVVRAALSARAPHQAIEALDRYAERYPHGQLHLEASVLRIEALHRNGQLRQASALGQAFLSSHADGPMAKRVRAILASEPDGTHVKGGATGEVP